MVSGTGLRIGIAGAGLLGRLLAWQLGHAGHRVEVFDWAPGPQPAFDGAGAAGFSAAGMLSPLAELDHAGADVAALGWRSIALWHHIAEALPGESVFSQRGSLLLAHRADQGAAQRVLGRIARAPAGWPAPQALTPAACTALEPALHGVAHAWLLPDEAQVQPLAALQGLHAASADTVRWHWGAAVRAVAPGQLQVDGEASARRFDWVFDVRGLGARDGAAPNAWPSTLRGVRGETAWLQLPAHGLTRPVRLLHPRHPVYIVPRGADRIFVGATEIESEDRSGVSLRSAVELMAAAHSVMPGLAEARIERLDRNLRPALPDNAPRTEMAPGLVRINGLFRHGWLMAPALIDDALAASGLVGTVAASSRAEALTVELHV